MTKRFCSERRLKCTEQPDSMMTTLQAMPDLMQHIQTYANPVLGDAKSKHGAVLHIHVEDGHGEESLIVFDWRNSEMVGMWRCGTSPCNSVKDLQKCTTSTELLSVSPSQHPQHSRCTPQLVKEAPIESLCKSFMNQLKLGQRLSWVVRVVCDHAECTQEWLDKIEDCLQPNLLKMKLISTYESNKCFIGRVFVEVRLRNESDDDDTGFMEDFTASLSITVTSATPTGQITHQHHFNFDVESQHSDAFKDLRAGTNTPNTRRLLEMCKQWSSQMHNEVTNNGSSLHITDFFRDTHLSLGEIEMSLVSRMKDWRNYSV